MAEMMVSGVLNQESFGYCFREIVTVSGGRGSVSVVIAIAKHRGRRGTIGHASTLAHLKWKSYVELARTSGDS